MTDELKKTVKILRPPKIAKGEGGRSVWLDPVETANLELVSTAMLKQILSSDDQYQKQKIRDAADGKDGVLAHNVAADSFEIIDDADLQAILDSNPKGVAAIKAVETVLEPLSSRADIDDEELSLVSTQALRVMLRTDGDGLEIDDIDGLADSGGSDPYNTG